MIGKSTAMRCFVTLGVVLLATSATHAAPSSSDLASVEQLQRTLTAVADDLRPSVVAIRAYRSYRLPEDNRKRVQGKGRDSAIPEQLIPAEGTGVIIREDGLILTSEHVVRNAKPSAIDCVLSTGERFTVTKVQSDPRSDLAVLRIDAKGLPTAQFGDLSRVRQGHFVIVMGNPFGSASDNAGRPAMSFGIVGSLGRDLTDKLDPGRYYGNLIQTDARVNPGNSGGPLVNLSGEVIGIVAAISSRTGGSEGAGYAIPIEPRTRSIIERLARGERIQYGFIGVLLESKSHTTRPTTTRAAIRGARLADVTPGSPADQGGLRKGDVITAFDEQAVESADALIRLVGAARVGQAIVLTVYRDGEERALTVTPTRRPEPSEN